MQQKIKGHKRSQNNKIKLINDALPSLLSRLSTGEKQNLQARYILSCVIADALSDTTLWASVSCCTPLVASCSVALLSSPRKEKNPILASQINMDQLAGPHAITRVTNKHERTDSQMNPICGSELDSTSSVQLDRSQWDPYCLLHKKQAH